MLFIYLLLPIKFYTNTMKKLALVLLLALTLPAVAQKREKIKGSKNITVTQREIGAFDNVEIEDNIEAYLVSGGAKPLEIEADHNLHEAIMAEIKGTTLRLYTSKEITSAKKIAVRINTPATLKEVVTKHSTILYALTDLKTDSLTIKSIDYSKLYLNVKSKYFALSMNDKVTAELNLKTTGDVALDMRKDTGLKALISCQGFKLDMYQKTAAAIEGDAQSAVIRLDNNAVFTGKRFTVKNMELTAESYCKSSISVSEGLTMSASGKTVTELFGNPEKMTVTLKKFADSAVLAKKEDNEK